MKGPVDYIEAGIRSGTRHASTARGKKVLAAAVLVGIAIFLVGLAASYPSYRHRQDCMHRVAQSYVDADKVFQQPANLDGFCAAWHNDPPGY